MQDTGSWFDEGTRYWINNYGLTSFGSKWLIPTHNEVTVLWMKTSNGPGGVVEKIHVDELTPEEFSLVYEKATFWNKIVIGLVIVLTIVAIGISSYIK